MAIQPMGKVEQVDVGRIWPHEALDFTPWLEGNIALLGEALHLDLESVQREAPVGPFFLDLLAREIGNGVLVAIENQYGWTDHSHLGQLLTYAAGLDVRIVIWIAPEFRDEHRSVLDWLNRWMPEEMEFYGVEVRAISISGSPPAPLFVPVAFPSAWSKQRDRSPGGATPINLKYRIFYQPLIDEMRQAGLTNKTVARANQDQIFPSGYSGVEYHVGFWGGSVNPHASVYLWINEGDWGVFDVLEAQKDAIEAELDASLTWVREAKKPFSFSYVGLEYDGRSIHDPDEDLDETRKWMCEWLPKFRKVMQPRLKTIVSDGDMP